MRKLKDKLRTNLINARGWRTSRKIIVFESDDWGMIRMASKEAYDYFLRKGFEVDKCPYNKFDTLENNDDLELLLEVLSSTKDSNGNPAIFTINNIVANPDFQKIKASGFSEYFYTPFTDILNQYPNHDRVMHLYKAGISQKLLKPQFHGREHVNVRRWLHDLRLNKTGAVEAFGQHMFSVHVSGVSNSKREYLDTFGFDARQGVTIDFEPTIKEGVILFQKIWGYAPTSFIAPCYTWHSSIESSLSKNGIQSIQGGYVQISPESDKKGYKAKRHYQGEQNKFNQVHLVRNVHFEPSEDSGIDSVASAMNEITVAFRWKKPAIISTHRVNYMGGIFKNNRSSNLKLLIALLKGIRYKWPSAEFLSSDELAAEMKINNR